MADIGISIAYKYDQHIKVDLIFSIFKSDTAHKIIDDFVKLCLGFNLFLAYQGVWVLQSMNARKALSAGMRMPLVFVYASLPLSCLFLL